TQRLIFSGILPSPCASRRDLLESARCVAWHSGSVRLRRTVREFTCSGRSSEKNLCALRGLCDFTDVEVSSCVAQDRQRADAEHARGRNRGGDDGGCGDQGNGNGDDGGVEMGGLRQ